MLLDLVFLPGLIACVSGGDADIGQRTPDATETPEPSGETATPPTTAETGTASSGDTSTPTTEPCDACPDGTSCGSANGIPVCRDTVTGIPRFEHVIVYTMENTSFDTLELSTNTPFLHSLMSSGAFASDYHGIEHPSLPNYIEMVSGTVVDNGPLECDCRPEGDSCDADSCNAGSHDCGCPQSHAHLGDQLDAVGATWRAYAEDMGEPCNLWSSGDYAPKHVPFLYFPTLTDDGPRCTDHVVEYVGNFAGDLATGLRRFSFVAPDLVHDMHNPYPPGPENLANGDAWLSLEIPAILASPAYTDRGLLILVWDEDESDAEPDEEPVPMILLSPLAKGAGFASAVHYTHDALLATIEDGLGVPRLAHAVGVRPLDDFFPAN